MNRVQMEAALGGVRHGDVADMNRIECAAEERDRARRAVRTMAVGRRMCVRRRAASMSSPGGCFG